MRENIFDDIGASDVWGLYEEGKKYLDKFNFFNELEDCNTYYSGMIKAKEPSLNIIKPIIDYKVASINSRGFEIYYSNSSCYQDERTEGIVKFLNECSSKTSEKLKLNTMLWDISTKSAIEGCSYAYFFWDKFSNEIVSRRLNNISVLLSDEQEVDIQNQLYIILVSRRYTSDIEQEARKNGVENSQIELINSDEQTSYSLSEKGRCEIKSELTKKALCLTMFYRKKGIVHMIGATKDMIYLPERKIEGMKTYPVAKMIWRNAEGSSRGSGDVHNIIQNQIEINKAIKRQIDIASKFAYPHIVYDCTKLENKDVESLSDVGANIGLDGTMAEDVGKLISYLIPPNVPNDSINLVQSLMSQTRELAGASEAVTGAIDPEQASGRAILAVQDAAAVALSEQSANLVQFVEDMANIWLELYRLYLVGNAYIDEYNNMHLALDVKVDISPSSPFSKYAQEQTLQNFLKEGYISFEEYLEALPDDASVPKSTLERIVKRRGTSGEKSIY